MRDTSRRRTLRFLASSRTVAVRSTRVEPIEHVLSCDKEVEGQVAVVLVVIGEAPAGYLNYYPTCDTITQNTVGDIAFECGGSWVLLRNIGV